MKYALDQVIRFGNGEYLILDIIKYNNSTFLYLINNSEFQDDISIVKVLSDGSLDYINDENEFDYVLNKIFIDNQVDLMYMTTDIA
jgi:hypothetical protein